MIGRISLALCLGVFASATSARAETKAGDLAKLDRKKPSRSESAGVASEFDAQRLFEALDVDQDRVVSHTELVSGVRAYVARRVALRFQQLDANRDGRVSALEVPRMAQARFVRFDVDRNGEITEAELLAHMLGRAAERSELVFARIDLDRDGQCSGQEIAFDHSAREQQRAVLAAKQRSAQAGPSKVADARDVPRRGKL
jgi:Ca2+-binding EF-hand superfamily protein